MSNGLSKFSLFNYNPIRTKHKESQPWLILAAIFSS